VTTLHPALLDWQGHYDNAVQLINRTELVMCQQEPLPIDLKIRRGAPGRGVTAQVAP